MPNEIPTVWLIHAEPLAEGKGKERIIAELDDGDIAVATRAIGETIATAEISFNLGEAAKLARLCLAGNTHALTTPGLARILCAGFLTLERVAAAAGALEEKKP